jgi:hypothetical protein
MIVWVEHWTGSTRMIPRNWAAGIATQARKTFHVSARHVHVDTTSFSVSGTYEASEQQESEASVIAITYGYSRDHREDLCTVDAGASHDPGRRRPSVLATFRREQQ